MSSAEDSDCRSKKKSLLPSSFALPAELLCLRVSPRSSIHPKRSRPTLVGLEEPPHARGGVRTALWSWSSFVHVPVPSVCVPRGRLLFRSLADAG